MRIALVVRRFPAVSETFIVRKVVDLVETGADLHVVADRVDHDLWASMPDLARRPALGASVHGLPLGGPRWRAAARALTSLAVGGGRHPALTRRLHASSLRQAGASWSMVRTLRVLRPDVVHFEFGDLAAQRIEMMQVVGRPATVSFRGADIIAAGLDDPTYYQPVWARASALHTLGLDLRQTMLARGCPPGLPCTVIPPSVDTEAFPAVVDRRGGLLGPPDRPLRVLSVGRLVAKKGHEYGVAAVAELRDRGMAVEYRILGDGSHRHAVAASIDHHGLDGVVELGGAVPHAAVVDAMRWADVLLYPSVSEGFGNVVLEAQSMCLVVVCTDAEGLAENVVNGETGIVVARRDPAALAAAMTALANDPARRTRFGTAGRARVATHFRPEAAVRSWLRFYEDVVSGDLQNRKPARTGR